LNDSPSPALAQPLSWITTADGSLTCDFPSLKERYHNLAGAYTEANLIYVTPSNALAMINANNGNLTVMDVCFGLGYNTWVLLATCFKQATSPFEITVYGFENDPHILTGIPNVLEDPRFNDLKFLNAAFEHNIYYQTQQSWASFDVCHGLGIIHWRFYKGDFRTVLLKLIASKTDADLVFHDAFAPAKVPELWTVEIWQAYAQLLKPAGRLLTYSAMGAVRGGLLEAGFQLYKTPSLGQKNGGTMATLTPLTRVSDPLSLLSQSEQDYLQSQSGIPFRNPNGQWSPTQIQSHRAKEQADSQLLRWDRVSAPFR